MQRDHVSRSIYVYRVISISKKRLYKGWDTYTRVNIAVSYGDLPEIQLHYLQYFTNRIFGKLLPKYWNRSRKNCDSTRIPRRCDKMSSKIRRITRIERYSAESHEYFIDTIIVSDLHDTREIWLLKIYSSKKGFEEFSKDEWTTVLEHQSQCRKNYHLRYIHR